MEKIKRYDFESCATKNSPDSMIPVSDDGRPLLADEPALYYTADLQDPDKRAKIEKDLEGKVFEMRVTKNVNDYFMFFACPKFAENIYGNGKVFPTQKPQAGEIWAVEIHVIHRPQQNDFTFVCKKGDPVKCPPVTPNLPPPMLEKRDCKKLTVHTPICGETLANITGISLLSIISELMTLGKVADVNQELDADDAIKIAAKNGVKLEVLLGEKIEPTSTHTPQKPTTITLHPPSSPKFDENLSDSSFVFSPQNLKKYPKENYQTIASTLQKITTAQREDVFLQKCPPAFKLTFEFVKNHRDELQALIALFQSLANSGETPKLCGKTKERYAILYKPEYQGVRTFLKSLNGGIVSGKNYAPETKFSTPSEPTSFSQRASHIRIYIDETWPGLQSKEYGDIGVICGIVWEGEEVNYDELPKTKTHLRCKSTPNALRTALRRLRDCRRAFPFIFPIFQENVSTKDYPELLRIAVITLLGWILPQKGTPCDVKIFCEGIDSSLCTSGENLTANFQEMVSTLRLTQNRFTRWTISQAESLPSESKEFEYLPYADSIGYTVVPTQKAVEWCDNIIQPEKLEGYVPLSATLIQELCTLDTPSAPGYADALVEFAKGRSKTKLFAQVMANTVSRAKENLEFRTALFDKLESMFEQKERNLKLLNTISNTLVKEFPIAEFDNLPKQKLIRILVELQAANHSGESSKVQQCVEMYQDCRRRLLKQSRDLCAYADMNLVVHYNDRFEFSEGAKICRQWENEPAFEFLSPENQGRILSSIGQSYAIERNYSQADEYFSRALEIFTDPENNLLAQADQTAVYRALNLLDDERFDDAVSAAEDVFKCSFPDAIEKYAGADINAFHHHLLVKNLYFNPQVLSLRQRYLLKKDKWSSAKQHPWELIELYRTLMQEDKSDQRAHFRKLEKLYDDMDAGETLHLLQAFASGVYASLCGGHISLKNTERIFSQVEEKLPATKEYCRKIRALLSGTSEEKECWKILPFNYQ